MAEGLGIERVVQGDYDDVVSRTVEALKSEGFGVLTRIDVKATLKEKLDADFTNYVILGACNPPLAHKALTKTKDVGLLLPCNVIVYEREPGSIVVSAVNPKAMLAIMPDADLSEVADPAFEGLTAAVNKV